MIFSLDVRRARKGDCLLLHFGTKEKPRLAMIDGGPSQVYGPYLKPRLKQIRKARGLNDQQSLPVDLLMVSHVDDDHIKGILDLTDELLKPNTKPLIKIANYWHNSFEDLVADAPGNVTAQFGAASITAPALPDEFVDSDDEEREVIHDTFHVLAGIAQGQRLRDDATKLKWPRNSEFNGDVILAGNKKQPVAEGLTFIVAGPMKPELDALRAAHAKWVEEQKKKKKEGPAALAAYADKSVANLSSIVVLASVDNKTMLLTGDARGDKIIAGLKTSGVLTGATLHVDVLKVPHHGSSNNLEPAFFKTITADHYVFSGDGEHGNPERDSLDWLFQARKNNSFTVHLTYPVDEIDLGRKADWEKEQAKEKAKNQKLQAEGKLIKKQPREDWSPVRHSLAALIQKANLRNDQKISIVEDNKSHVIDLLERLNF